MRSLEHENPPLAGQADHARRWLNTAPQRGALSRRLGPARRVRPWLARLPHVRRWLTGMPPLRR
jgi:hypothetical protein